MVNLPRDIASLVELVYEKVASHSKSWQAELGAAQLKDAEKKKKILWERLILSPR